MRYSSHIPPNTKELAIDLTVVACENRQNAITFARVNNSDLLRALKHLMETRLNGKVKEEWEEKSGGNGNESIVKVTQDGKY